jgi:hypothetical protein
VRDLFVRRVLNSLGFLPQLIGLGLRHLARIDQSTHAGVGYLLYVAGHAGPQRLTAEPILTAIFMIVRLAIVLLALGNGGRGHSWKQNEDEGENCRPYGGTVFGFHVSKLCLITHTMKAGWARWAAGK